MDKILFCKPFKFFTLVPPALIALEVTAQSTSIIPYNTTIERVLTSSNFGECMFEPTIGPAEAGMACSNNQWVTVDCAASLPGAKRSLSMQKWETINLAYATGKTVRVRIDPQVDIQGHCWLEQVQTCPDSGDCGTQPPITPTAD